MSKSIHPRLLVTGAGGHLGRAVVENLLKAGISNVIAGTRNPDALSDLDAKDVTTLIADFDDRQPFNQHLPV
jgi:NAD(P)H dehydrogenase (quinone)